jgi:hypothetical protein
MHPHRGECVINAAAAAQVMHKDTQEKLQSYQVNKSQLVEMRDALAKDKAATEKQLSAVATKLAKVCRNGSCVPER